MRLVSERTPVARQEHECMASVWVCAQGWDGMGFTRQELRAISKAKKNKWKIQKGEKYTRQCTDDGEIRTFIAITDIHNICINHSLYAS